MELGGRAREAAGAGKREKRADVAQVVDHGRVAKLGLLSLLITEIRTIQLSNSAAGITFKRARGAPSDNRGRGNHLIEGFKRGQAG
jgi:hypothetical protein